jgi:hypothetical protein
MIPTADAARRLEEKKSMNPKRINKKKTKYTKHSGK